MAGNPGIIIMKPKTNEIIGAFPGDTGGDFCLLRCHRRRWEYVTLSSGHETGENFTTTLKRVLTRLKFSKRRRICIGIPRNRIFMREISFPNMSEDQALSAARLGINLYCHLEQEDIYHDEWVFSRKGIPVVIIAYTLRQHIDEYFELLEDLGYGRNQIWIAPATVGLDILLRQYLPDMLPCTATGKQGQFRILSLHGENGWEGSHFHTESETDNMDVEPEHKPLMLPAPFHKLAQTPSVHITDSGSMSTTASAAPLNKILSSPGDSGPLSGITWALCSASIGLSRYPAILFQDGERKRPFRLKINTFQVVSTITIVAMLIATGNIFIKINRAEEELAILQHRKSELAKKLAPLQENLKKVEELRLKVETIKKFENEYARPLDILKALAESTPDETWIKSFNLRKNSLRLSAEGGSAIDTMQAWRDNPLFSNVKLTSPVTKNKDQEDRFTVDITISGDSKK
jgi:Tfp pilus assembly protein PilN